MTTHHARTAVRRLAIAACTLLTVLTLPGCGGAVEPSSHGDQQHQRSPSADRTKDPLAETEETTKSPEAPTPVTPVFKKAPESCTAIDFKSITDKHSPVSQADVEEESTAEGTECTRVSRSLNYPSKGMIGLRVRVNTENPMVREHDGSPQGSPLGGEFYDTSLTQVFGGVANFRNGMLFYYLPGVEIIVQNALGDVSQSALHKIADDVLIAATGRSKP